MEGKIVWTCTANGVMMNAHKILVGNTLRDLVIHWRLLASSFSRFIVSCSVISLLQEMMVIRMCHLVNFMSRGSLICETRRRSKNTGGCDHR